MTAAQNPRRQPRRSSIEVHRLLLEAAERVVSREGSRRATVTAIAAEAGVAVSRLYQHFDSREGLLEQAIQAPLTRFMERWRSALPDTRKPTDDLELMRLFVQTIYESAVEHRGLIQTLLVELPGGSDAFTTRLMPMLSDALEELEGIAREHARQQGIDESMIPAGLRATITTTLTAAVLGPSYVQAASAEDLIDTIARISAYGIRQAP